jgi:dephospho-CoA kinase
MRLPLRVGEFSMSSDERVAAQAQPGDAIPEAGGAAADRAAADRTAPEGAGSQEAAPEGATSAGAAAIATCQHLAGTLFPWDISRALELALLKTFCVPSISGLLSRTGEFEQRPRKRYDDTGLMVAELLRHGPTSEAGAAVIARMNRIHGAFAISDRDYLYVLSTFVCEPIRWLARYGWRALSAEEEEALFRFWALVGERMGIAAIPATLAELVAFNQAIEAKVFANAPSNRRVADATLAMLLGDWPAPLRPGLARVLGSLLSAPEAAALGWPEPPTALQRAVLLALRLRSRLAGLSQRLRPPRGSRFYSERPTPSYGKSFQLEQLGPPARLAALNRPRWAGRQRRIGLTGGIATGKSSVARLLAERHGLPVLDADHFAREALAPGSPGARAVLERYGERVLPGAEWQSPGEEPSGRLRPGQAAAAGMAIEWAAEEPGGDDHPLSRSVPHEAIDRAALGRIVFADAAERSWLEALVHPIVRQRISAELARLAAAPVVVLMIPLLLEAGLEELCSEVWLVDCDEAQQLGRLIERDQLSAAEAQARIAAQWPLERKRALVDRLIDNRGNTQALEASLAAHLEASPLWSAPADAPPAKGPDRLSP